MTESYRGALALYVPLANVNHPPRVLLSSSQLRHQRQRANRTQAPQRHRRACRPVVASGRALRPGAWDSHAACRRKCKLATGPPGASSAPIALVSLLHLGEGE